MKTVTDPHGVDGHISYDMTSSSASEIPAYILRNSILHVPHVVATVASIHGVRTLKGKMPHLPSFSPDIDASLSLALLANNRTLQHLSLCLSSLSPFAARK
jgi:hypothetical protein